ncbi:ribosome biogenesis GTPase YlqF [Gloeocapsa sp. PCC 73106]|uniref:ribosome biogenesis GTPase YlqF n=1 Tax=Gloeocapsa sp. PCC 73106 TaxID=102232 RepID=UPI0002AD0E45|nr:ribosome biogenesis GTPase YlqF [Gloeocapsa sp. PCC 73106]ELR97034.1 ribosome biogenesis GTP-binding protein YlqF [Gloeocapsa sp. PCC 73106]
MPVIQWYPGHIAKAERALKEQLKRVDLVLEVRDARIPLASHHPQLRAWIGTKPRLLIINRLDMISQQMRQQWLNWFRHQGEEPYFTDAHEGIGIKAVTKAAQLVGVTVNEKRRDRGLLPRPVRAVVIGFPNVGKSALINRLLGKKIVPSARRPGVTRQLRWVRISEDIELLDAPGVIPVKLENQENAIKLAICEDIGEAAYDSQLIASAFIDLLLELPEAAALKTRYNLDVTGMTGEAYLEELAIKRYQGSKERATMAVLNDFRTGNLGAIALEFPPI